MPAAASRADVFCGWMGEAASDPGPGPGLSRHLHDMIMVAAQAVWYASGMACEVCANITGTVWKVEVREGDVVEAGQTVVILESMKMELPIEADQGGKVARVHVAEGQAVEQGAKLITLA